MSYGVIKMIYHYFRTIYIPIWTLAGFTLSRTDFCATHGTFYGFMEWLSDLYRPERASYGLGGTLIKSTDRLQTRLRHQDHHRQYKQHPYFNDERLPGLPDRITMAEPW